MKTPSVCLDQHDGRNLIIIPAAVTALEAYSLVGEDGPYTRVHLNGTTVVVAGRTREVANALGIEVQ